LKYAALAWLDRMWALGLLRRRTSRVLLTVVGVALAVGLTTTMLSVSAGLETTSHRVLAGTGVDLLVLDEGSQVISNSHRPFPNGTAIADALEARGDVVTAFPIFEKTVTLFPANFSACAPECVAVNAQANGEVPARRGALGGVDVEPPGTYFAAHPEDAFAATPEFKGGLYPEGFNSSSFTGEVLINRAVARELGAGLGDTVYLSVTRQFAEAHAFTVVGVYEASFETGQSREVRVHMSELQFMDRKAADETTAIALDLADPRDGPSVAAFVEAEWPGLRGADPEAILSELDATTEAFTVFAALVAVVSIAVAVLFAATIFMISARERVAEIAALRAIGISRRTIFRQMLLESGVVGGLGLLAGLAVGTALALSIDFVLKTTTQRVPHGMDVTAVTPEVLLLVGATSVLIGVAAGLVPALWATRLPIASAIRNL
jgi:ABC-type lipoprotein release transport system permease subunit